MTRVLKCDAIFPGCPGEVRADTDDEVIHLAVEHAKQVHGVVEIDSSAAAKVKAAIRDG